jgi:hypothetical protein
VLNLDVTDRRRLVVAAALTIVALPAIWLFARGEPSAGTAAPTVAGAAGVPIPGAEAPTTPNSSIDPFGTDGPIFVDGPTTPPKPAIVEVAVPAQVAGKSMNGTATYKHSDDPTSVTCTAIPPAPFNATLTITNVDNGFHVDCINRTPRILPDGLAIELPTSLFQQIAQLIDAPVPVRISWTSG